MRPVSSRVRPLFALSLLVAALVPVARAATPQVAGGNYFGIAVDESGRAWRWGHDTESPSYPGGACDCSPPEPVPGTGPGGQLVNIVAVDAAEHALALAADGTVWAWGANSYGQLGRGATGPDSTTPQQVHGPGNVGVLSGIIAISAGERHSMALKSDGTVWAWGNGTSGQLGNALNSDSSVPVQVKGVGGTGFLTGVSKIEAGWTTSLVLVAGTPYVFGTDYRGQSSNTPVAVAVTQGGAALTGITQVSAGANYALFLKSDGTILAWGAGSRGQLGNGRMSGDGLGGTTSNFDPAPVKSPDGTGVLTNVTQISAGDEHAIVLRSDGSAWTWGDGSPNVIGGPQNVNALGLGVPSDADGPYQPLPIQVHGVNNTGVLTGLESVEASTGSAFSAAITPAGLLISWGSNYYGELGFKDAICDGCDVIAGGGTMYPREVCALRLRDLTPELTCPQRLDPDTTYTISWTPVTGATGYRVQDGANPPFTTTQTSFDHVEGPAECLPEGFAHQVTFKVAALVDSTCDPEDVTCTVDRFSPYTKPPDAPTISCPQSAYIGQEIVLDWDDDVHSQTFEVDVDGDGVADGSSNQSTINATAPSVGDVTFRVRGVNLCGAGDWSEPCTTHVRPDTSHCMTMSGIQACTSGWIEDPPGTFTATSDYIRLSAAGDDSDSDYAIWISGALRLVPADDDISFDGLVWLDTPFGRLDVFDNQGETDQPDSPPGSVTQGALQTGRYCKLPRKFSDVGNIPNCGIRMLLSYLPCADEKGGNKFIIDCLPMNGAIGFFLNFDPTDNANLWRLYCLGIDGRFGVHGVPENGDIDFLASAAICPSTVIGTGPGSILDPAAATIMLNVQDLGVNVAGCQAEVHDGWLSRGLLDTTTPFGIDFGSGELRCPILGDLRTNIEKLYVGSDDMHVDAAHIHLSNLDAFLLNVRDFEGDLVRRDPPENGYKICGDGILGIPFLALDAHAGVTLLDGDLQRACVNASFFQTPKPVFPGIAAYFDRLLGGCYTAFTPDSGDDTCSESPDFQFAAKCLDGCLQPPTGQFKVRIVAGIPGPWGSGMIAGVDPAGLQFAGDGARVAGTLALLGHKVGTVDACIKSWAPSACATIDVGGIVKGDAALGLSADYGVAGQVDATVDLPFIGCCGIGVDPAPFGASAYLGPYQADGDDRYGFVTKFQFLGERTASLDIRTMKPSLSGVTLLSPFTPQVAGGESLPSLPADVVAQAGFMVAPGSAQAIFIAQSPDGVPEIQAISPSAVVYTKDTPGVHSFSDDDASAIAIDSPEAGGWQVLVTGLPPGSDVTMNALGEPQPASIMMMAPATPGTTSLHVAWDASVPSAQPATTLRLTASQDPNVAAAGGGQLIHSQALVAGDGGYDIPEGLLPAGEWTIAAVLDDGIGHVSVTTAPAAITVIDTTGPDAPDTADVTPLFDGARVSWSASASPDVLLYQLLVQEADAADTTEGVIVPVGDVLTYDLHGLTGESPRRYLVRAVDKSLNDGSWIEAGIVAPDATLDSTPPAAPTGLELTADTDTSFTATWTSVQGATEYRVHYGVGGNLLGKQADQGFSPVSAGGDSLSLSGFKAGQVIAVAVSAVDAFGNESAISPVEHVYLGSTTSADGDALPDAWEQLYFGDLTTSDGTQDSDFDFLTDAEELALGMDPLAFDDFAWGDADEDGDVDIGDVVKELRFSVALDSPDPDELRRADVAPATVTPGDPPTVRPTRPQPSQVTVADVVELLRVVVGLAQFEPVQPE